MIQKLFLPVPFRVQTFLGIHHHFIPHFSFLGSPFVYSHFAIVLAPLTSVVVLLILVGKGNFVNLGDLVSQLLMLSCDIFRLIIGQ